MSAQHPRHAAKDLPGEERQRLINDLQGLQGNDLLAAVLASPLGKRTAVTTSFGAESAVLLHLVARIYRDVPVLFINTGRLFPETLAYRDLLVNRLKLTNVRTLHPTTERVRNIDPDETLYKSDPNACCEVRKVEPYLDAIEGFDVLISGRKRFQGGERHDLELVEPGTVHLKINPLTHWNKEQIDEAFDQWGLPRHPLVFEGYRSIGCTTCTQPCQNVEMPRTGRWNGHAKTECGIHTIERRQV